MEPVHRPSILPRRRALLTRSFSPRTFASLFSPILASLVLLSPCGSPARASDTLPLAPAFSLPTREGNEVNLDSLRGKVVVIDFWASWCGPCARSFPWLSELRSRYSGKPFEIVAINLDKKRASADAFLADHPAPFVVAFDPKGETADAFGISALPTTIVLGPTGNVLYTHRGFDPKKTGPLEARIEKEIAR